MRLYIMRHGDAVLQAPSDAERPLSPLGEAQCSRMVSHFSVLIPDRIVASPYLRAQQSAAIVQSGLRDKFGQHRDIETLSLITPNDNPKKALQALARYEVASLLMVSHQPLVGDLVSLLIHGHLNDPEPMTTASVACIEADILSPGMGELSWLKLP